MNEWKKLGEIENWRRKKIKHKGRNTIFNFDILYNFSGCVDDDLKILIANDFDCPVWKEVTVELPSYDAWIWREDKDLCPNIKNHTIFVSDVLTRKELLRRYIEHLASIVNEGWIADWANCKEKKYYIVYNARNEAMFTAYMIIHNFRDVYLKSEEAAQLVIDHAEKELLELYGVKK